MSAYTRTQRQSKRCLGVRVPSIHRRVCHFHRHPASHQLQEQGKKKRKNESGSESIPEFFFLLPYIHLLFKNIYMPIKATGESELEARKKKYPNHIHTHTHTHTPVLRLPLLLHTRDRARPRRSRYLSRFLHKSAQSPPPPWQKPKIVKCVHGGNTCSFMR